ncbi:hypothetical protein ART_1083 [Arthrobacter sp. PAMC 25486]|uniref:hypothetical protein n=1 Tax=Arthrobacter sp. PAMC 25486 TaxID=1494608 RepID=UPI000535DF5B|nr:hypothetical protein [Arthrobacter sp. PAMC 25486]AIY00682.1 hypothetical protein ART_1083 [Arthrobacter sp. PAMC 25486]
MFHDDYTFHMENEQAYPSQDSAARQLRNYEALRSRTSLQGPSRAFALFTLWSAIIVAVYVAVFLFSFGGRTVNEVVSAGGYSSSGILVFPVLLFSSLVRGARERFGIRTKPAPGHWIAYGLIIVGFMTLAGLSIAGVNYPWGLNLLVVVAIFVTMATGPIRQLRRSPASDSDRWGNEPLDRLARLSTTLIGVAAGLLAATITQAWFPLVSAVVMMSLVVVLIGWQARWGLPRTGYEWGPIHWMAFGIVVSVLFLLSVLLSHTSWITTPNSVSVGILVFLVMLIASFLPTRARHR